MFPSWEAVASAAAATTSGDTQRLVGLAFGAGPSVVSFGVIAQGTVPGVRGSLVVRVVDDDVDDLPVVIGRLSAGAPM